MCSDPHKQIQKHFLKRNQTYIPIVYLGVIISLLNVLWGSVNIGGRSKLRRGGLNMVFIFYDISKLQSLKRDLLSNDDDKNKQFLQH